MNEFGDKLNNNYIGAKWQRLDFHLHSPGSFSFTLPSGLNLENDHNQIVSQYVQALVNQGIQIGAITDYQGIHTRWFSDIQQASKQNGIIIYPGVELSFNIGKHGLHILAIFPLGIDQDAINTAIQALDIDPAEPLIGKDGKHRNIDPASNFKETLAKFREKNHAILIFAHPNNDSGLLKSCSFRDAAEIINHVIPDGIETFSDVDKQKLLSTGVFSKNTLDRLSSVDFSDPKAIGEIGTKKHTDGSLRATFIKLSINDDIQAIRLALHDPQILITTGEKPVISYTHLIEFEVEGNGFLGGIKIALSPELNILVGGRGVGKSAILETIRYVLNMEALSPREYRENLVQHALGSGGKAILFLKQFINPNVHRQYRLERVLGEDTRVYELDPEREIPLTPAEVLGDQESPLYFGQREIYDITRQDSQRLKLLDDLIGSKAQLQIQQVQKIEVQLRDNARSILEKRRRLLERGDIEQRLKEISHKIDIFRRHGLVEKLREATSLSSDDQRLLQSINEIENAINDWQSTSENWHNKWESILQQLANAESSQKVYLNKLTKLIINLQEQTDNLFLKQLQIIKSVNQDGKEIYDQWNVARQPLEEEIRLLKQKIGSQNLDPDELIRLTTEQTSLEPLFKALETTEYELTQLLEDRNILLNKLRETRRQAWIIRDQQAKEITKNLEQRVEVKVVYKGQLNGFENLLVDFFRGSGIDRKSIERIAFADPVDGITIAEKIKQGQNKIEADFGLSNSRAQQLCEFFKDETKLFELQLLSPDDVVQVSLKLEDRYTPLQNLSDGQRATAMLLILLVQDRRLLIVDQPEDDLDNRFIYEDIVRILREQKGKRQLLAATHNPNIPVLGPAELIVALDASNDKSSIITEGAIDNRSIHEFVRNVMEGGEDAFRRRAQKYGWF